MRELDMVVDLAVVDSPEPPVVTRHGLAAARCEVEDRATPVTEHDRRVDQEAGIIGAAVREGIRHQRDEAFRRR